MLPQASHWLRADKGREFPPEFSSCRHTTLARETGRSKSFPRQHVTPPTGTGVEAFGPKEN